MRRITILITVSMLLLAFMAGGVNASAGRFTYRWFYYADSLGSDSAVARLQDIMKTAKAAGYNGIALNLWLHVTPGYDDSRLIANLKTIKQTADILGLDIYPLLPEIGESDCILSVDPNLAEGPPVRDAVFVAHGGQATLQQNPASTFANGDFEQVQGDRLSGWSSQTAPGVSTFSDGAVEHGGNRSLRMENFGAGGGDVRVGQSVPVIPFREYKISVWVKTRDFTRGSLWISITGKQEGAGETKPRELYWPKYPAEPTQDWTHICAIFNSLNCSEVNTTIGVIDAKGGTGKVWFADAKFEEVGLLNLIRREGCPVVVKGDDGTVYKDGVDFNNIKDQQLGDYTAEHMPPVITLTQGSNIKDGEHLKVSYFHRMLIWGKPDVCCLSDPRVYGIIQKETKLLEGIFHPKGYFMSHDEIRCVNWCDLCTSQHKTPGQLLSDSVNRTVKIVRKINPKATLFDWSDMFDPYHNAVDNYHLCNGTLAGSWKGIPRDIVMIDWNGGSKKSLAWFAGLKIGQILSENNPQDIQSWLKDAGSSSGVVGVMYTTWESNYDGLAAYAQAAWGSSK